ncbi:MAG: CvpA family protein [Acidimicrobiia bacterium]|nr:CvpA family protein [Acidimicrobiia bacterium]
MVDLVIAAVVVASVFTGYVRGVARELIEFVAMLVAIPIAFRVGPALISAWTEVPEANGALIGGFAGLLVVTGIVGIAARIAQRSGVLAPPEPPDRIAGGVVGVARSISLVWVLVTALAGAPVSVFASATSESRIATAMTGELPVTLFTALTGNQDIETLIYFNRRFPNGPLVSDDVYELPAFDRSRLTAEPATASEMLVLVNVARSQLGASPLQWSNALAAVAEAYAFEMYVDGFFAHDSFRTGNVGDRVQMAGITYRVVGENLALAPTLASAHDGLMNSPGHRANILGHYSSVGIGAVRGPLGLVIVQVFRT